MNLKPCPDCGREVSKSAKSCPQCGRAMKKETGLVTATLTVIFIVLLVLGIISLLNS
jgi:uncharacterized protein (DUF983 family)